MITAVLDANVVASGALSRGGPSSTLIDRWRAGIFILATSSWIIDEVARTLQ